MLEYFSQKFLKFKTKFDILQDPKSDILKILSSIDKLIKDGEFKLIGPKIDQIINT